MANEKISQLPSVTNSAVGSASIIPLVDSTDSTTKSIPLNQLDLRWMSNPMTTGGDLIAGGSGGTPTRLGNGSLGQILASLGSTNLPAWFTLSQYQFFVNLGLSAAVASNALTVSLKQADGATNPSSGLSEVIIPFRSSTVTLGAYSIASVSTSLSLTVPSGATLGTSSTQQTYLWVYALNSSGTISLGISQYKFDDGSVQSTTAIGGSSNSNSIIYSASALTNVPVRLIGRVNVTESTAGTWATAPSEVAIGPFAIPQVISAFYTTAAGQTIPDTGAGTIVNFGTKIIDTLNCVTTGGSWVFTCPAPGIYEIAAGLQYLRNLVSISNNSTYTAFAVQNNTTSMVLNDFNFSSAGGNTLGGITLNGGGVLYQCAKGDLLNIYTSNTNNGNPTLTTDATRNWVSIRKVG